jgi:hypothetical protein
MFWVCVWVDRTATLRPIARHTAGTTIIIEVTAADGRTTANTTITLTRLGIDCTLLAQLHFTLHPPTAAPAARMVPAHTPTLRRYTIEVPAHCITVTLAPKPLDAGAGVTTNLQQCKVTAIPPGTSRELAVR